MSPECAALLRLNTPDELCPGDMWLCRRLGIVKIMTAHKRGQAKRLRLTNFHLYHWGKPSLYVHPYDFRDNDNNAHVFDLAKERGETWEFVGNLFSALPYSTLTGVMP